MTSLDKHLSRIEFALAQTVGETILHPKRYGPELNQRYRDALDAVRARRQEVAGHSMVAQNRQAVADALVLAEAESSLIPKGRFDR